MSRPRILIVGGGLAGLSTGCYALTNGWDVTIVEHNLALGGVCTAWRRGPYVIDGCIHWLMGGPFSHIYEELQIVPPVRLQPIRRFATVRSARDGWSVDIGPDLAALRKQLVALAPADADEIDRIVATASQVADLSPQVDRPPELASLCDHLRRLWELREQIPALMHFRGTAGEWTRARISSPALRQVFANLFAAETPMLYLLATLGYLERGWLSRPIGGTEPFRDALIARYHALGGEARLDTTVEEIVVKDDQAQGVRLTDGTMLTGDLVVSTASMPETVLRLLGGRHGAEGLRDRLERWKLFDPIVLLSWGVARSMPDVASTLLVVDVEPTELAGRAIDRQFVRVYNEDPSFAPAGHTMVQSILGSDYEWWATRGTGYGAAKAEVAERARELLAPFVPGLQEDVRMTDVATPLTFWRHARSWRGAFEGWWPSTDEFMRHVPKTLPGLGRMYMAGQWVEPGGGVPTALMSGRQLVQILCAAAHRPFVVSP